MNLSVRHQINRIEFVVFVETANDFGQIFARERFAACENQNSQITAQSFGNFRNFVGFHLQFLARTVIKFFGKKTMRAAHIADTRYQNVQKNRRNRSADQNARVSFKNLFCCKIHLFSSSVKLLRF